MSKEQIPPNVHEFLVKLDASEAVALGRNIGFILSGMEKSLIEENYTKQEVSELRMNLIFALIIAKNTGSSGED